MKGKFHYKREEGQNPRTGIMSFQHTADGKMYSDIVVLPENNMTETERVEVYPIAHDALENGREEGWYPASCVAYYRVLWRDFEPRRGEYCYSFIEDIIDSVRKSGQELILRLMAHSTRASDDVPDWLRELVVCPERPEGKRVKDSPTDPLFLDLFIEAVRALGERFDGERTLYGIDISLPGAWGEGYKLELYPEDTLMRITEEYMRAFPKTQLFAQCIRPEIINHVSKSRSIGWRGDGLGNPEHMLSLYPPRIERISDKWLQGPVSFESYWWMMEWQRRGWDLDMIIEKTLEWHISSFNPKSMPIPPEWRERVEEWIAKMGYHFTIDTVEAQRVGDSLLIDIVIENVGVAPMYQSLPFVVRLSSSKGVYELVTSADTATWLPGKHRICQLLPLPEGIEKGEHRVDVGIRNYDAQDIYFATDAPRTDGLYTVGVVWL